MLLSLLGLTIIIPSNPAYAGMEKYVKKKKLDPLESYVPLVIQARDLLERVDISDAKGCRQLLRSGPLYGIRTCIKAIGDYAAEQNPSSAGALVSDVFTDMDSFDYFMRSPDEGRVVAREKLNKVLLSLDQLLATVPAPVMAVSRKIVASVAAMEDVAEEEGKDDHDKALTSLLK